jgi:sugar phosphate isomerase/epimerase
LNTHFARGTARALGKYARHIHFKDAVREEGKSVPRLIGQGELPLTETLSAIRSSGYAGWICLETEKRWHPREAPEPEESLPQFVRWMKENET